MPAQVSARSACADVRLLGSDTEVTCGDGHARRYVNLDYAASTAALPEVWDAVTAFMPWYSSVHRGSGRKSQVASEAYEDARDDVRAFVGATPADDVILVRNTTEALNVLAAALPAGTRVLGSPVEHHANMLPWRRHDLQLLPFPESADALCAATEQALRRARPRIHIVALTGASNVTGEVWPLERLAAISHRHGARLVVDAAQLAPHRPIDMAGSGIDFLAFSGHKLYAPFGAGALVGPVSRLGDTAPLLQGGGAVKLVTLDHTVWADAPDRHEAGSPNVIGAVALGAACRALTELGMDAVAEHERTLAARLRRGLDGVPGLEQLAIWHDDVDRVGVASFRLAGYRHPLLAAILSAEHAIGVRHGCFCAHPLIAHLLRISGAEMLRYRRQLEAAATPQLPGAVRASLGLGSTEHEIDQLVNALAAIVRHGPALRYEHVIEHDEYLPVPVRFARDVIGNVPQANREAGSPLARYRCPVSNQRVPGGVVHKLPADLREALIVNTTALDAWRDITPLARNEFICWVEDAKQETTRERRIRRTQEELEDGQRRPCCWPGCKHRDRTGH